MDRPQWFPDELAHAGHEHLDPDYVPGYDRKSATNPEEDLAPLIARGLNETQTLVDLGAGTGTFALAAAPHCQRVIAVDVSAQMLGVMREKADAQGIANIDFVRQGFLTYEHRGEPADVVYSRHALHHLPDFWKVVALGRIADMLKPGGIFMLRDLVFAFEPDAIDRTMENWFAGAVASSDVGWTREELEEHVREEHSTFSWLLEPMLERTGFEIVDAKNGGGIYSVYTCVRT